MKRLRELDAPIGLIFFLGPSIIFLILAIISLNTSISKFISYIIVAIIFALASLKYVHTSLYGKDKILQKVAASVSLPLNAKILDVGCGHGAFMLKFEKQSSKIGQVVGIDIWNKKDQANNSPEETKKNIAKSEISDKAIIKQADMCKMPFKDSKFDLIVSSLAIHNVKPVDKREKAIKEMSRVLKRGGKIVIVDIEFKDKEYKKFLKELNFKNIEVSSTGFNGWWGVPTAPTFILKAVKQ